MALMKVHYGGPNRQGPRKSVVKVLELQDEKLEREAADMEKLPPLALRDELVIDKFRDQMIQDLRKRKMLPGMEKNLTELITDGLTVIPKHAKEGLVKEYRDVLISIIRDRLKIHIFHLGNKHGIDLYNAAIEEDGWTSVDVVDIYEKKLFGMKQA